MSRVYVTQEPTRYDRAASRFVPKHDLSPAAKFGELTFLLGPGNLRQRELEGSVQLVRRALAGCTPDDYFLPLGDPVAMALVAAVASETMATMRVLKWDKHAGEYACFEIRLRAADGRAAGVEPPAV